MNDLEGCQIPCLPRMADGTIKSDPQPIKLKVKRWLAVPWNYFVKVQLKKFYAVWQETKSKMNIDQEKSISQPGVAIKLQAGDLVRVRSFEEIQATLNPWKELKGCAFLPYMRDFCGTTQRVLKPVERFLDERDYKVKRTRGVVLLENVICSGTPVFGQCDRGCHLFWRIEWLEKIET
jgi:hypothetical protein